jgi:VanZ family protein
MNDDAAAMGAFCGQSAMRSLLVLYCLFILYGSFIPFSVTTDPDVVRHNLSVVQLFPFQDGKRNFSIPDVSSNVVLFVPLGFLLVGSGLKCSPPGARTLSIMASVALAAAFSTIIEIGQLFSPGRTGSLLDVEANTTGAVVGAAAARLFFQPAQGRLARRATGVLGQEPALLPLGLLAVALAADSFYPFAVTLDVSTAWHNFTNAQWVPLESFRRRFWGDIVRENAVNFALLAALARHAAERLCPRGASAGSAWVATLLFAGSLEAGKLLFQGRYPNVDNVILAAVGTLAGVTLIQWIVRWGPVRRHPGVALLALAIALLGYGELTPFDFALAPSAIAAKTVRIEWLPLASYYGADPQSALFDLWNKLLLSGFLGFAVGSVTGRGGPGVAAAGLLVGGLLESAQVLTVTRIPSVTDVLIFGAGAYVGSVAYTRYQAFRQEA